MFAFLCVLFIIDCKYVLKYNAVRHHLGICIAIKLLNSFKILLFCIVPVGF